MRTELRVAMLSLTVAAGVCLAADEPPAWAYAIAPAPAAGAQAAAPASSQKYRLDGSSLLVTRAEISDPFGPADWFPRDHPPMPDVVAHGRRPDVRACSLCHYPNGKGRPENAGVAGLPVSYFIQQMEDFRSGARKSAEPRKANTNTMIAIAKAMTPEEIKAAAEYFGPMNWTPNWTPWIRVVETVTVPKTRIAGGMFLTLEGNGERLGQRIIETPESAEDTEILRNPRSGFIAYAPIGSIKKGAALVTTGAGKTTRCAFCHGADLKGLGPVPGIAGRSPSYLVRQMYDMQQDARKGVWASLMKPVVAPLSQDDMLAIAAYLSSRMQSQAPTPSCRAGQPCPGTLRYP